MQIQCFLGSFIYNCICFRANPNLQINRHVLSPPPNPSSVNQDLNGQKELCPRLCHLKKGPNGYGFNLHSEKSRPGQFIRSVDPDSPASRAGLRPQDRLVEVTARGLSTSLPGKPFGVSSAYAAHGCSILPGLAVAAGSCPARAGGERDGRSDGTLGKPEAESSPHPLSFSIRSPRVPP